MPADSPQLDGPDADAFGRQPGLAPPVRPALPWAWLAGLLCVLGFVVVALVRPPGPLDQRDLAYQRDGLLREGPVVTAQVGGVDLGGHVVVLVFDRNVPSRAALKSWLSELSPDRDVRLVLPAAATGLSVPVVVDPDGRLARAVELPRPRDGGLGIGYAIVDADRTVRYATLDPSWLRNGFEVATIAGTVE